MASEASTSNLLTVGQVADKLNCSIGLVYRLVESGALPAVRIGPRALRVDRSDLAEYLLSRNDDDGRGAA